MATRLTHFNYVPKIQLFYLDCLVKSQILMAK